MVDVFSRRVLVHKVRHHAGGLSVLLPTPSLVPSDTSMIEVLRRPIESAQRRVHDLVQRQPCSFEPPEFDALSGIRPLWPLEGCIESKGWMLLSAVFQELHGVARCVAM